MSDQSARRDQLRQKFLNRRCRKCSHLLDVHAMLSGCLYGDCRCQEGIATHYEAALEWQPPQNERPSWDEKPRASLRDMALDVLHSGMGGSHIDEIARDLEAHAKQKEALYTVLSAIVSNPKTRQFLKQYSPDLLDMANEAVDNARGTF